MKTSELKTICESLIDTFNYAGKISIDLYQKGLKIEIKKDKSPVSNGDLKVNKLITDKKEEAKIKYTTRCQSVNVKFPIIISKKPGII